MANKRTLFTKTWVVVGWPIHIFVCIKLTFLRLVLQQRVLTCVQNAIR